MIEREKLSTEDIITYTPLKVKIITDMKIRNTFRTPEYNPIMLALRHKYLTIKELVVEYNKLVKERVQKMDLSEEEKEKKTRQETRKTKTIYRYVKMLVDAGLVVAAGKRIKMGQIASETLYTRVANLVYFKEDHKEKWDSNVYDEVIDRMVIFLQQSNPDLKITKKSLKDILLKIDDHTSEVFSSTLEKMVDEKTSYISGLTMQQNQILTQYSEIVSALLSINNFKDEIAKFKK